MPNCMLKKKPAALFILPSFDKSVYVLGSEHGWLTASVKLVASYMAGSEHGLELQFSLIEISWLQV